MGAVGLAMGGGVRDFRDQCTCFSGPCDKPTSLLGRAYFVECPIRS